MTDVQVFKDVIGGSLFTSHLFATASASNKGDGGGGITMARSNRAMGATNLIEAHHKPLLLVVVITPPDI